MTDHEVLAARVTELESRMALLESASTPHLAADLDPVPPVDADTFWVLQGIKERVPAPGAVFYAGAVQTIDGAVDWQIGYPTERLLSESWANLSSAIAALGHPVRLSILQAALSGAHTVSEFGAGDDMGTTGQIYHHIHQLTAQGWLVTERRGRYAVPPERVVPLLTILAAAHR